MKHTTSITLLLAVAGGLALPAYGNILVSDTWQDGTRNDPAAPVYADNNGVTGVDADSDGSFESAWFKGGAGTLTAAANDLQGTGFAASSASWYTYFTPAATPVTLGSGDQLKLTWSFSATGINANNTSQGFNVALALTPSASRVTGDASLPSVAYLSYAMQMNMGNTLGNANPFQLRKWTLAGSGALLGTSGNYTSLANGGTSGNTGFVDGTTYTLVMTLTHNLSGGMDITSTMSGGSLNNTGSETVAFTDTTASEGFAFDTFAIRPSNTAQTATTFDTSLFQVEYIPAAIPEPSTFALAGLGLLGLAARFRRVRR